MAKRWALRMGCALALALGTEFGLAQATPPQTTHEALRAMTRQAGVIFTGEVTGVRRLPGTGGSTGVVEIDFAVEDAIRGVSGEAYTLREWAGLCPAEDEPFHVGQRYLMLLYPPSAAGLSSPVGGMDGAIPIRGTGPKVGDAAASTKNSLLVDGRVADLRWVGTRVVRTMTYRAESARLQARPSAEVAGSDVVVDTASAATTSSDAQSAGYATVLGLLRSWEKAEHATR
ncbi:MAG: hypothetical protein P4K80_01940 [Acidobacteriaceae bacterium]|nr:hypothetical protein [Acidobacteriaceae bacterium]